MDNLEIELWLSGIDAVLGKRCTEVIHGQSRPRFVLGGCQELVHGSRVEKDKPWHLQGLKQSHEPARSLHLCVYEHAGMHRMQCRRQIFEQQGKEGVSFTKEDMSTRIAGNEGIHSHADIFTFEPNSLEIIICDLVGDLGHR